MSEAKAAQVEKHLLPNRFQKGHDSEAAAKAGRKGAAATNQLRRERKTYREIANALRDERLTVRMPDGKKTEVYFDEAVVLGLYRKAMAGDHNAAKLLLEVQGEYQNSLDLSGSVATPSVVVGNNETAAKLREILNRAKKEAEAAAPTPAAPTAEK